MAWNRDVLFCTVLGRAGSKGGLVRVSFPYWKASLYYEVHTAGPLGLISVRRGCAAFEISSEKSAN